MTPEQLVHLLNKVVLAPQLKDLYEDRRGAGRMGLFFEDFIRSQRFVVRNQGIDIPAHNLEIKTRRDDAISPSNLGTISQDDLLHTLDFDSTQLYLQCKKQLRITLKKDECTNEIKVKDCAIYDLAPRGEIEKHRKRFQLAKQQLVKNSDLVYINVGDGYYYEKSTDGPTWYYRASKTQSKKMVASAQRQKQFNEFFEW